MKLRLCTLLLCACSLLTTIAANNDNLLSNGDFEETTQNPLFGTTFTDWTFGAELTIETNDVYSGTQAMRVTNVSQKKLTLQQEVSMLHEVTGQEIDIVIHYKVIEGIQAGDLRFRCLWETNPGTEGTPHDSLNLNQPLPLGESGWQEMKITTTKPTNGTRLYVGVEVSKGNQLLFDAFSVTRTIKTEPWFTVTPEKIGQKNANVGEEVLMATLTIRQGLLSEPVYLDVRGADRTMFALEKTEVTAEQETVQLWYCPTKVGTHKGMVVIESNEALEYNTTLSLTGVAIDPNQKPEIQINPTTLPTFVGIAGEKQQTEIQVSSSNCIEDIRVTCTNEGENAAFSINSSLIPRNTLAKTIITFAPNKAGKYNATIRWETKEGEKKELQLEGEAIEGIPPEQDWATNFVWDMANPTPLFFEHFDNIETNKTLKIKGWQNVVLQGKRPWWGYEDVNNDTEHCAKATAYIGGETASETYEMWLVSPALDYKNAENQVFTFRVRGDYLTKNQSARLQLYFIDAAISDDVYMQDLQIIMPATEEETGDWIDYQINLAGQEFISEVFFMAFRFTGMSGAIGTATYLIDDVSWGRKDLPIITPNKPLIEEIVAPNQQAIFSIMVEGENLTEEITISIGGTNKSKFQVTPERLPIEGGTIAVGFKSEDLGVHEAYLRIRSRGAIDLYIPMAILVQEKTSIENTSATQTQTHLILTNGTLYLLTQDGLYTIDGRKVTE